jgi:hypothetical protein
VNFNNNANNHQQPGHHHRLCGGTANLVFTDTYDGVRGSAALPANLGVALGAAVPLATVCCR